MNIGNVLRFLKDEFVYGGHLLSLGAVSIVFTAAVLLGIAVTWDFLVLAYLTSYIPYSYNRLVELKEDYLTNPARTEHIKAGIHILPAVIVLSFLAAIVISIRYGNPASSIFEIGMVIGSLFYSIHFKDYTRRIIGFKSLYVSFFWASLIFLMALYYRYYAIVPVFITFFFVFLRFIVSTVFFDIKDIRSDMLHGLKTLPVFFGKKRVLSLLHYLNAISFFPILIGIIVGALPLVSLALIIFWYYSYYYLELIKRRNSVNIQKLSYIMVDGEYVLWAVAVYLLNSYPW